MATKNRKFLHTRFCRKCSASRLVNAVATIQEDRLATKVGSCKRQPASEIASTTNDG